MKELLKAIWALKWNDPQEKVDPVEWAKVAAGVILVLSVLYLFKD